MKFTGGKSKFDPTTGKWISSPRIYTDFHCSIDEWTKLGNGRKYFMYQLRSFIAEKYGYKTEKRELENGLNVNRLSFKRDDGEHSKYSADIVRLVIKEITNREPEVNFYAYEGMIDHIEVSFPGREIPNIVLLVREYGGSTNSILIECVRRIYDLLRDKTNTTGWFNKENLKYFNQEYDNVCLYYGIDETTEGYDYQDIFRWRKNVYGGPTLIYTTPEFLPKKYRRYDCRGGISYSKDD